MVIVINMSLGPRKVTLLLFLLELLKQRTDYYISRGSHAFVWSIDYCKVFDKVNYWKLFMFKQSNSGGIRYFRLGMGL